MGKHRKDSRSRRRSASPSDNGMFMIVHDRDQGDVDGIDVYFMICRKEVKGEGEEAQEGAQGGGWGAWIEHTNIEG